MSGQPDVSIIMPVLNEEGQIGRSLSSIAAQDYPADKIEVVIAEGGSTDRTVDVIDRFGGKLNIRLLDNSSLKEAQIGKTLALEHASGDVTFFLDADVWLPARHTLRRLVAPLIQEPELAGSIAPYAYVPGLSVWARYLSLDPFQRDPLIQALTPGIEQFITREADAYSICEFPTVRIPPIGQTTLYWRSEIDPHRWDGYWREVDHPAYLIKQGRTRFAYVPGAGLAHAHCRTLKEMVRKRIRNLLVYRNGYLRLEREPDYVWLDTSNRAEVLRLARWFVGTNLILPRLVEGIREARHYERWEPLLRPIVALAVADGLLAAILASAEGRRLIRQALSMDGRGEAVRRAKT